MRKTTTTLLATLVFCLLAPASSFACKCAQPPAPKEALKQAAAVFTGKVTKIERDPKYGKIIHLTVSKQWKGVDKQTVTVKTGLGGGDYGYGFQKDKIYLVYCHGKKELSTNICTRTKPLAKAKKDLEELGPPKEPGKPSS